MALYNFQDSIPLLNTSEHRIIRENISLAFTAADRVSRFEPRRAYEPATAGYCTVIALRVTRYLCMEAGSALKRLWVSMIIDVRAPFFANENNKLNCSVYFSEMD